jgi:hypothetical protein
MLKSKRRITLSSPKSTNSRIQFLKTKMRLMPLKNKSRLFSLKRIALLRKIVMKFKN